MLAVIDIGNTNIVLGLYLASKRLLSARFATDRVQTVDELGCLMCTVLQNHGFRTTDVKAVCASSVVPGFQEKLSTACEVYWSQKPVWVGSEIAIPMSYSLDMGYQPGIDRLINAYSAWRQFQTAVIAVDLGTATTLDVVSCRGEYMGGAIVPGLELGKEALSQAIRLPLALNPILPTRVIGKSTQEQVQIGICLGYAVLIDGLVTRMQFELASPVQVIATGGLAPFIQQASKMIQRWDPDLTLEGLRLLYQEYISGNSFVTYRPECIVGHQAIA